MFDCNERGSDLGFVNVNVLFPRNFSLDCFVKVFIQKLNAVVLGSLVTTLSLQMWKE